MSYLNLNHVENVIKDLGASPMAISDHQIHRFSSVISLHGLPDIEVILCKEASESVVRDNFYKQPIMRTDEQINAQQMVSTSESQDG